MIAPDILVADRDAVNGLPEQFQQRILDCADDEHVYILSEVNGKGGDMIGQLQYWEGQWQELPVLHEYVRMRRLAGLETDAPEEIAGNTDHPLWQRIENIYFEKAFARDVVSRYLQRTDGKPT